MLYYILHEVIEINKKSFIMKEKEITFHSEEDTLKAILVKNMGNRKKTADELGISTTTLWRKLKKYQIFD